ncbi:MAG TPA: hypothetical protein VNH40_01820, partial [Gaiellaceae bacterium]|nr:hypothetical protein [Gaiellaceae bacterium]
MAVVSSGLRGRRRALPGLRRLWAPIAETRGLARVMLVVGAAVTLFFVVLAFFARWIAPYGFSQYASGGHRFPQLAAPSAQHVMGTTVESDDVLARVVWGAQTELKVVL